MGKLSNVNILYIPLAKDKCYVALANYLVVHHSFNTGHENSTSHRDGLLKLKKGGNKINIIYKRLLSQCVLKIVVSVVKKLASRGLEFRGDEEVFSSVKNGNFMMCLELISEYDSFLADHIRRFGNPGKGFTSYFSPENYEEFNITYGEVIIVVSTDVNHMSSPRPFATSVHHTAKRRHQWTATN
ncbi:hypothetical protein PR048_013020, partial [Dryococelus australis]